MSIYEHFEHAQNSALLEIQTLVLICQPCRRHTRASSSGVVAARCCQRYPSRWRSCVSSCAATSGALYSTKYIYIYNY